MKYPAHREEELFAALALSPDRNDDWENSPTVSSAFTQAGAFALPVGSKDAALVIRLSPGGYTVVISGSNNTSGMALVEIYDLDP